MIKVGNTIYKDSVGIGYVYGTTKDGRMRAFFPQKQASISLDADDTTYTVSQIPDHLTPSTEYVFSLRHGFGYIKDWDYTDEVDEHGRMGFILKIYFPSIGSVMLYGEDGKPILANPTMFNMVFAVSENTFVTNRSLSSLETEIAVLEKQAAELKVQLANLKADSDIRKNY